MLAFALSGLGLKRFSQGAFIPGMGIEYVFFVFLLVLVRRRGGGLGSLGWRRDRWFADAMIGAGCGVLLFLVFGVLSAVLASVLSGTAATAGSVGVEVDPRPPDGGTKMRPRPFAVSTAVAALVASVGIPHRASAQRFRWPQNPENLQVLADSIRGARLGAIMRGFSTALDVRCSHCHVGEGEDLTTYDFPSDDKEAKRIARVMIAMVRDINGPELDQLAEFGRPRGERVEVTCTTCHRGQARPRLIEDVFLETVERTGLDSATAQYRGLRDRYYGGFSYDFRPGPLGTVAERLAAQGRLDEAIEVLRLALEFAPDSYSTYYTLAVAQERAGRREEALASMEKALELAPPESREFLGREVERLRGGADAD